MAHHKSKHYPIAIHEAGHAVAAQLFKVKFGGVSITPDCHSAGRLEWVISPLNISKIAAMKNAHWSLVRTDRLMAIIALAGWAAEWHLTPRVHDGAEDDFKHAR